MDNRVYKTASANAATVDKQWLLIDAEGQTLGRLCSTVASLLRGKHKTNFTPHVDCGDNVVIINAEKIQLTGKKWDQKEYVRFSGYPGGQRFRTAKEQHERNPISLVEKGVKGMLPKNRLGRALFRNMHVYAGAEHSQAAQQPQEFKINA